MVTRKERTRGTRDDAVRLFTELAETPIPTGLDQLSWYSHILGCAQACLRDADADEFREAFGPMITEASLSEAEKLQAVVPKCKSLLNDWAARLQDHHIKPELMIWRDVESESAEVPAEPKITADEAVAIAIAFAKANGVGEEVASGGCTHLSDSSCLGELGFSLGYGEYLVVLLSNRISNVKHWQTGEPTKAVAMRVTVNDQTGEADRFWQL